MEIVHANRKIKTPFMILFGDAHEPTPPPIPDGSAENPFLIKTAWDFKLFRDAIIAGNTFSGIYHKLVNDLDLSGITYNTGISSPLYNGVFNGNFRILKNFSVTNINANDAVSVFSGNMNGKVRNLAIINATINRGTNTSSAGSTGVIGASVTNGTIENCYVTGTLNNAPAFAGAIGGYGSGTTIRNCLTNVQITKASNQGNRSAGILGDGVTQQIVENCIALGNINGGGPMVVGICFNYSNSIIRNCVAAMAAMNTSGTSGNYRILYQNTPNASNNYALNTMTIRGSIPTSNIGASALNGANATQAQLQSLAFYRDTMGWDMVNVWEIDDGVSYPRLRGFNYDF
jgi:hypothetical protein